MVFTWRRLHRIPSELKVSPTDSVAWCVHLVVLQMNQERNAIHSIRNDLTPILFYAELALAGDRVAQKLVIKELVGRAKSIHAELDVLTTGVRRRIREA
jgi:hypothetical protein